MVGINARAATLIAAGLVLAMPFSAQAQILFPDLFPRPPANVGRPPADVGRQPADPRQPGERPGHRVPSGRLGDDPEGPLQPRVAPVRPASEEGLVGTDALHNGASGRLRLERLGRDHYGLRLKLEGTAVAAPGSPCAVELGNVEPLPLVSQGRPAGLPRYAIDSPICAIVFDIVGDAALVVAPQGECVFEAANCRVNPRGLWGPEGRGLGPRTREIERVRGRADGDIRTDFRQLMSRMKGTDLQAATAEQANFSSARDVTCRSYVAENAHGYCAAKLTEARAAAIKAQLATLPPPQRKKDGKK
jgi:hypothetical protein